MFVWRSDAILSEIKRQMPALSRALENISQAWGNADQERILSTNWQPLENIAVDYGIMEHAARVAVLPANNLEWSDVGSWDALYELFPPDQEGNVAAKGNHLPISTSGTLVYSTREKLVVSIGVNDLIIVDTEDAILVCQRDQAQKVREVIERLKAGNKDNYL
jgi:mannose-1-phosphate guanylyltransferase